MASLSDLSVRRPVLATVLSLAIVLGGLLGFRQLGVREYPVTERPVVSVQTSLRGANAAVIESQVTEPLEAAINATAGVVSLTSQSSSGSSRISVEFEIGTNLDAAAAEVRDRVSRTRNRLPADVEEPVVAKADADGAPILFLNLASSRLDLLALTDLADNVFVERLQTIDGVAAIDVWGAKRAAMRLWLDPARLTAFGLTPADVRAAVQGQNVELAGGRIEGDDVDLQIRPITRLNTVEDFENLVLKNDGATLVRFKDVGRVTLEPQDQRQILKRDGVAMVGIVARPLPGANVVNIADEFRARVAQIERDLPEGVEVGYGFDNSVPVRAAIAEVEETLLIALGLVLLILFLFLRDWRSTLVPLLVIPVSIVGAFGVLALLGYSINVLTLLALVLAIGIVVDDAIVVLENIYSKIEGGMAPMEAAMEGTREIFVAVLATTLALVVVFLPIIFQQGLIGALFREFGVTLAAAVAISAFAALSLTPMLASRLLKERTAHPWFYRVTEPFFVRMNEGYRRALHAFLGVRWMAFVLMALAGGAVYVLYQSLEREVAPMEDRSRVNVSAQMPQGRGYAYTLDYADRLAAVVAETVPEADGIIARTSTGSANLFVMLPPPDARERSQDAIAQAIQQAVRNLPGARVNVSQNPTISTGGRGLPVQFVIQAPTLEALQEVLPRFMDQASASDKFAFVRADLEFTLPELQVTVDRARAMALGIDAREVGTTLALALSEQRLGYFLRDGKQYEIIAQLEPDARATPSALGALTVRSASGAPVPLTSLVTTRESAAPPTLQRFDRFTATTVSASPAEGVSLGAAIEEMDRIADATFPSGFSRSYAGQSRDFRDSSGSALFVFGLALVLVYLVLAAQFESYRDPFIVLLTVPLALAGALGFLWYFDATLNVFSQIGLVMLVGLVTKNGILIVEFARQRQEAGATVRQAAEEGAAARFRPILMTSFATVLGALPIALALGAGAESRVPMGLAVIGGLIVGTGLTLFVIPALYTYLAGEHAASRHVDDEPATADVPGDGTASALPDPSPRPAVPAPTSPS